jgi:hypothetical protein
VNQKDNTQGLQVRSLSLYRSPENTDVGYASMGIGSQSTAELVMQRGSDILGGLQ